MTGKILVGNCVDLMADMPDGIIDLTVTSPPYDDLVKYNGYTFDFEKIAEQLYRVTNPDGGTVVWIMTDQTKDGARTMNSFRQALHFVDTCGFRMYDVMVWLKHNSQFSRQSRYTHVWEFMFILCRGQKPKTIQTLQMPVKNPSRMGQVRNATRDAKGFYSKRKMTSAPRTTQPLHNVWRISHTVDIDYSRVHPAVYPERLAKYHILTWSRPGDLVLDPMCGSGTTPAVAHSLGRRYLGMDISDEYVRIARRRIAKTKL